MKKLMFILFVLTAVIAMGATTLTPGQVVVLNTNSDGEDGFSFRARSYTDAKAQAQVRLGSARGRQRGLEAACCRT